MVIVFYLFKLKKVSCSKLICMKSIFEIITILVFLFIITLFQKMDEDYCDNVYNAARESTPITSASPANNKTRSAKASYKAVAGNSKTPAAQLHPTRSVRGRW